MRMLVRVAVFVVMPVLVLVLMFLLLVMMPVLVFILVMRVRRAFVDAELDPLDALALLPLEVHVKIAERELREFPFEGGRLDAEIDQCADRHVAADAGGAIEEENFHKVWAIED